MDGLTAKLADVHEAGMVNVYYLKTPSAFAYKQHEHWTAWKANRLYVLKIAGFDNGVWKDVVGYYIEGGACTVIADLDMTETIHAAEDYIIKSIRMVS